MKLAKLWLKAERAKSHKKALNTLALVKEHEAHEKAKEEALRAQWIEKEATF